jgi:hypothetical protein
VLVIYLYEYSSIYKSTFCCRQFCRKVVTRTIMAGRLESVTVASLTGNYVKRTSYRARHHITTHDGTSTSGQLCEEKLTIEKYVMDPPAMLRPLMCKGLCIDPCSIERPAMVASLTDNYMRRTSYRPIHHGHARDSNFTYRQLSPISGHRQSLIG